MKELRSTSKTHYIHRISYTAQESIVGLFVIIAVGILIWLLLTSSKSIIAFEESFTIFGRLETVKGISKNTEIKISGLSAGSIESIDIKEDNTVVVTMRIISKYQRLIRTDSTAKLTNPGIAALGGAIIHISSGSSDKPILQDGSTLTVTQTPDIKEILETITPTFEQLQSSIEKIDVILKTIDPEDVGDTINNIQAATADLRKISHQINTGDGVAGSLIYNTEMANNTKAIVKNLLDITQLLEEMTTTLNLEIANMPELVDKIGPLLNEADRTIKATQRIWPLSTAIGEQSNKDTLIPAGD